MQVSTRQFKVTYIFLGSFWNLTQLNLDLDSSDQTFLNDVLLDTRKTVQILSDISETFRTALVILGKLNSLRIPLHNVNKVKDYFVNSLVEVISTD